MPDAHVAIAVLGSSAAQTLRFHDRGRVFAVFQRSFYVRFGDDLVCFGPLALRAGPLNALYDARAGVPWPARGLGPGVDVVREDTLLHIDGHLRIGIAAARVWKPPLAPAAFDTAILATSLQRLAASVVGRAPGGFGPLLCPADCALRVRNDPLLDASGPAIDALRAWLRAALAGGQARPPDVDSLIGLGGGLTPSGDDYLCGVLTASNYFGYPSVASRLSEAVLPRAARETNLISHAYLRCAAAGEASSVLFDVLECLLGANPKTLDARLDAVDAVGHTSGWDCLAGAVAVCEALVG